MYREDFRPTRIADVGNSISHMCRKNETRESVRVKDAHLDGVTISRNPAIRCVACASVPQLNSLGKKARLGHLGTFSAIRGKSSNGSSRAPHRRTFQPHHQALSPAADPDVKSQPRKGSAPAEERSITPKILSHYNKAHFNSYGSCRSR
jgi:hypothetical protein